MPLSIEYFADGSDDCPLILVYGRDSKAAASLRDQIAALAAERIERVSVHDLPNFESIEGCRLFLSIGSRDRGTLALREPQTFECQLRTITWQSVEGLLEPFIKPTFYDGFQYLDDHGKIGLVISGHRGW